jgi:hypothetical protein
MINRKKPPRLCYTEFNITAELILESLPKAPYFFLVAFFFGLGAHFPQLISFPTSSRNTARILGIIFNIVNII